MGIKLCHGIFGPVSTPMSSGAKLTPRPPFCILPLPSAHLGPWPQSQRRAPQPVPEAASVSAGADSDQHLTQHLASNPNEHCISQTSLYFNKSSPHSKVRFCRDALLLNRRYKSQNNYIKEVTSHWKGRGPFSQSLPNSALKPSFGHSSFHAMNVFRVPDLRNLFLQDKFSCISMTTCREKFSWGKNISPLNSSPIGQCLPGLS